MAKRPRLSKVKSRLAKDVGEKEALKVYQKLLAKTIKSAEQSSLSVVIYWDVNSEEYERLDIDEEFQLGEDLGEKMEKAFEKELENYSSVLICGSDIPGLNAQIIDDAERQLEEVDVVIGPCEDGGYYLLGMKKLYVSLFQSKKWSSAQVLEETISDLKGMGLSFRLLKELADIDELEDLNRHGHLIE